MTKTVCKILDRQIKNVCRYGKFEYTDNTFITFLTTYIYEPKQILKNWRPITLLTVVHKIATGCIAERIKKFLDKLISNDQALLRVGL